MKKRAIPGIYVSIFCILLSACERSPKVFSVNNFSMIQDSDRIQMGITALPIPDITGQWTGLEHNIDINITNGINGLTLYSVGLTDTLSSKDSSTTWFDMHFMQAVGKPYIEVISWGHRSGHNFTLDLSTYIKINKLNADTVIIQMLNSDFTEHWLKEKSYKYFFTTDEKLQKEHSIYLTEDLPRLTELLNKLHAIPKAFYGADTIVRRK